MKCGECGKPMYEHGVDINTEIVSGDMSFIPSAIICEVKRAWTCSCGVETIRKTQEIFTRKNDTEKDRKPRGCSVIRNILRKRGLK